MPMPADLRKPGPRPALRALIAAALLTAIISVFILHTVIPAADRLTHGFLAYYVGAQTIRDGEPATRLYDDEWFRGRVQEVSRGRVTDIYLANPPTLAVAWMPLAYLPVERARRVWVWMSAIYLGCSIGLVATQLVGARSLWGLVGITALFTLSAPAREQFLYGQMYSFLLLLHVIGWRAYTRRQDAVAGLALGLAMALKLSGWPIGVLLLARRRWTAIGCSIVTAIVAAAVTLPWVGIDAWRRFLFTEIPKELRWPAATLTAYQDTTGFWQHWLRYDAQLNPNPLIDAPALAHFLTIGTTLIACLALVSRRRPEYVGFAAAVALVELLSPAAEQYHYIVLLLPLAVLWHEASMLHSRGALGAAFAATVLIAWPINFKLPHPGWAVLLSYPRLIGGWIAFTALLINWRKSKPGGFPADYFTALSRFPLRLRPSLLRDRTRAGPTTG